MPDYMDSLELAQLFNAPQTFHAGNVRRQVEDRCERAGIDIGKGGLCTMYTFSGDVEALIHTIEDHHRREARRLILGARPILGTLEALSLALRMTT